MNYKSMKNAVELRISKDEDRFVPVIVRLPDGSVIPVRAVDVQPNPETGERSVVLDTREMV